MIFIPLMIIAERINKKHYSWRLFAAAAVLDAAALWVINDLLNK